ncbi:MAG: hypothetical protein HS124_13525 [Anaerolineales bacterium]|nr:hypothetical protein [Anaerolineales bacterium]MCL4261423.1 hypothetical protein [Anaerolineales bacterium]
MKKVLLVVLVLLIVACAPQATVAPEVTDTLTPIVETHPTATASDETDIEEENLLMSDEEMTAKMVADFAKGKTEFPTNLNQEQYTAFMEELLRALETGEVVDLADLNEANLIQISEALTNQLNSARDKNPAVYNGEAVIDPETGKLLNYDGSPDKSEVIEMYWSYAGRDEQGNVKMRNGEEVITIQNSAGIENWEEIYTDPNDPRIEWPTNIIAGKNISPAQILMGPDRPNPVVLRMAVPIGETIGEVYVEGYGKASGLRVMILEDDGAGNIIFGKEMVVVGSPVILLFEGGKNTESATAGAVIADYSGFWKNLEQYVAHYMAIPTNQTSVFERGYKGSPDNYTGLIHGQEAFDVVSGEDSNDKDILLLAIAYLMKR